MQVIPIANPVEQTDERFEEEIKKVMATKATIHEGNM